MRSLFQILLLFILSVAFSPKADANAQAWKIYGPDMSGSYGGMQGLGGLEAVIGTDGVTRGMINDWWGNAVGYVAAPGGAMTRGPARFTGFGPEPGHGMSPVDGTKPLHELLGYRGLTLDPPGYFHMGTRSYDPQSGRWLSPDPMGHAGSLSLYDYCDNDPLNVFDPDGRFGKGIHDGRAGSSGADAPNSLMYSTELCNTSAQASSPRQSSQTARST